MVIMQKKIIFLFIVLNVLFSFSQEQENNLRIGIGSRIAFSVADMAIEEIISINPAIGITVKIPLASILSFNPELNLAKRNFFITSFGGCAGGYHVSIEEFSISIIPVSIQIMPLGGPLFYLESGAQLDIPFATKIYDIDSRGHAVETYYYTRVSHDLGFVLGFGWHISKHSALGIRGVLGLTEVVKEEESKYLLLGLSYSYFL
jgi:hypothetical protein